jgi:hypothetical protein
MSDPLLSIDTLIERPAIRIDGRRYEMLSPAELSLRQSHMFALWARKVESLQASEGELDEEQDEELKKTLGAIVRTVLPELPEDVFAKLSEEHKLSVAQVFTGLLLRGRMDVAEATMRGMGSHPVTGIAGRTGARRSPGSSVFSAVLRAIGWTGRRSP